MDGDVRIMSTEMNLFSGADVFAYNHYPTSSSMWAGDYPGSSSPPAPAKPAAVRCKACDIKQNPPEEACAAWECVKCGSPL